MKERDALTAKLFNESVLSMPFGDLEEVVMKKIHAETKANTLIRRDKRLSIFFFVAGTLLGLLINILLSFAKFSFTGMASSQILLLFQFVFAVYFLWQGERVFNISKRFSRL